MTFLAWIFLVILALYLLRGLVFAMIGKERVITNVASPVPFRIVERSDKALTVAAPFQIVNEGKQSALIIDVIARPQLASEQYDGMAVHGRAEMEGRPREDEYFEAAVLFAKGDPSGSNVMKIDALITMTARHGKTMDEALAGMVDLPIDIIYMSVGREPCHYQRDRIILTAEQLSELTGVRLVTD